MLFGVGYKTGMDGEKKYELEMVHPQSLGKVVFDLPEGRAGREDGLMELGAVDREPAIGVPQ